MYLILLSFSYMLDFYGSKQLLLPTKNERRNTDSDEENRTDLTVLAFSGYQLFCRYFVKKSFCG